MSTATKTVDDGQKREVQREPDAGPPKKKQLWDMDPSKSFSDWTLEVVPVSDDGTKATKTDTYRVHRCILLIGEPGYFVSLFHNDLFAKPENNTTRFEFPELAAKAMPQYLAFQYCGHEKLDATEETATGLSYLAEYFQNDHFNWSLQEFCKDNLDPSNCLTYYRHAKLLKQTKILVAVAAFCGDHAKAMCEASGIAEKLPLEFWLDVLPAVNITAQNETFVSTLSVILCDKVEAAGGWGKVELPPNHPLVKWPHILFKLLSGSARSLHRDKIRLSREINCFHPATNKCYYLHDDEVEVAVPQNGRKSRCETCLDDGEQYFPLQPKLGIMRLL